MSSTQIPPNELADLYESLYTMLEALPPDTHPAWELAIESVLFGGEGLAPNATNYGEQQAERNGFKISEYRAQYGDGNRVLDFPTLTTRRPTGHDQQYADEELQLPFAPESEIVLPLVVDSETLPDALSLLNEFPTAPAAETSGESAATLLNTNRFPILTSSSADQSTDEKDDKEHSAAGEGGLPPNELADTYDGLYTVLEAIPDAAHPRWKAAVESALFGGEYLLPDANAYGEQQGERNGFGMSDYRTQYGDGDRVTDFPAIATAPSREEDTEYVDTDVQLPVAPESETVLPLAPTENTLPDAVALLTEFPSEPDADLKSERTVSLLDTDALLADINNTTPTDTTETPPPTQPRSTNATDPQQSTPQSGHSTDSDADAASTEENGSPSDANSEDPSTTELTVLRQEAAGESKVPLEHHDASVAPDSRKYEDSEAERAHRRAQQRDPSDVVELGEEITLTLKQVDYSSRPPTIMGTKNRLVIFVIDAPQDLSQYDTIRATVIDYGGKNNSAEAAFSGYVN